MPDEIIPEELRLPIAQSTALSKVPAFSLLLPENLAHSRNYLRQQEERYDQLLAAHDARSGCFGDLIISFDYDVINDYIYPYVPRHEHGPMSRRTMQRAERHAAAKVLFDIYSGKRFLPLGTILDIEQAFSTALRFANSEKVASLIAEFDSNDDKIVDKLKDTLFNFSFLYKFVHSSDFSESRSPYLDPSGKNNPRLMNAISRLHTILLGSGGEESRSRWMPVEWYITNGRIHRPVFKAVFDYLQQERDKEKEGKATTELNIKARRLVANIADALSIAQIIQLILNDRKYDLSKPADKNSVEYLFVTNSSFLLQESELYNITKIALEKEAKQPVCLEPFTISPWDFLATRLVNDRPGATVTKNELREARSAVICLREALNAAAESPLWEDFRHGKHGCVNVFDLLEYIANMNVDLPGAVAHCIRLMEGALFRAQLELEVEPVRVEQQLLTSESETENVRKRSEAELFLDFLDKLRQLDQFLKQRFEEKFRMRLGLEMEHFGLSEIIDGGPEEDRVAYRLVKQRIEAKPGKEVEPGKKEPRPSTWLTIAREGKGISPVVSWRTLFGPLDALDIAKRLEEKAGEKKWPVFMVEQDARVLFLAEKGGIIEIPVGTFGDSEDFVKTAISSAGAPVALTGVECHFGQKGPIVAVGIDHETAESDWLVTITGVDWTKGTAKENADWVVHAFQRSYLSAIHIPGVRSWIEKTISALREGKV